MACLPQRSRPSGGRRKVGLTLAFAPGSSTVKPAMRVHRQQHATRVLLVPAVLLASLWAGGLVASTAGDAADQLATSRAQPGFQPAALRDRVLALRPPVERPGSQGRLLPLLGVLAAVLAAAHRLLAGWLRPGLTRGRSPVRSTPPAARAPPHLQSA